MFFLPANPKCPSLDFYYFQHFRIHIPLNFTALTAGNVHGLAFWFDVAFHGST
jgi:hypothetical protein